MLSDEEHAKNRVVIEIDGDRVRLDVGDETPLDSYDTHLVICVPFGLNTSKTWHDLKYDRKVYWWGIKQSGIAHAPFQGFVSDVFDSEWIKIRIERSTKIPKQRRISRDREAT